MNEIAPSGNVNAAASEPKTEIENLREEVAFLKSCGIAELAVRNPSVMDYMKHWEERAERAEDKNASRKEVEEERWITEFKADQKRLLNYRGRRYDACRSIDRICHVIDSLGVEDGTALPDPDHPYNDVPSDGMKRELKNQAAVLLRTILLLNDRGCSPQELRRF